MPRTSSWRSARVIASRCGGASSKENTRSMSWPHLVNGSKTFIASRPLLASAFGDSTSVGSSDATDLANDRIPREREATKGSSFAKEALAACRLGQPTHRRTR
jgi:hypothetical protein